MPTLLLLLLLLFLVVIKSQQVKEAKPEAQVAIPAPTPTPRSEAQIPSISEGQAPLTFGQMNALYGPCVSLPVLMYHHTQDSATAARNGNGYLTVTPETFEKQLAYLNDQHYVSIGPADLIAFFNSGQSLPKKPIMLTFDDGYSDFATTPGRIHCAKQRLSLPRIRIGNTALSFYGL